METVVVERVYEQPLSDEAFEALLRRDWPCFRMRRVKHLKTYLSKDRLRGLCFYEAPDAAAVREAHDQEGYAYARIWTVDPAVPGTAP